MKSSHTPFLLDQPCLVALLLRSRGLAPPTFCQFAWRTGLQQFADETRLRIHVSHLPPGTSKWNKIEHRLFCHITQNWRGKPLRTFETIVDLIGNTRTGAGLRVKAKLDKRKYPTGVAITKAEMSALSLHRNEFHGDWNYELHPR